MIIKIGDLQLGGESRYQIEPGIQGLDAASIRNGDGVYAGVDGAYMSSQLYGARNIVLTGFYVASSCGEADTLRVNLCNVLSIRKLLPILITTFSGNMYYTEGYVSDLKADIDGARAGEFQVTLFCPDPILYKANENGIILQEKTLTTTGTTTNTSITNNGFVEVFPTFKATGYIPNFRVTNTTTNMPFRVDLTKIVAGSIVEVDMQHRLVTETVPTSTTIEDITNLRTTDSRWWSLVPGVNNITIGISISTGGSSIRTVEMTWKEGVRGI